MQKLEAFQVGFGVGRIGRVELWRGTGKRRQGGRERRNIAGNIFSGKCVNMMKGGMDLTIFWE